VRLALVIASGLTLFGGIATALSGGLAARTSAERVLTAAGLALLAGAWLGIARAALKR
jgi:hypothetical protein